MKIKSFAQKIAFIIGGSSGIGLATAKNLAKLGANVFIFARTEEKLKLALTEISLCVQKPDQKVGYKILDVSKYDLVKSVLISAVKEYGIPHLLINCAGRALPHNFEEISFAQFDETMHVNLYGIWNTCSVIVPFMKENGGGAIANVSSLAGIFGLYGYTDYCASKFAVIGLSETLRSELKPDNISVSILCPSDTDTPGLRTENLTKPPETIAISGAAKFLSPDFVAVNFIKGIQKGTKMIFPSFDGKFLDFLKRFFPFLEDLILDSIIAKSRKTQAKK